MNLHLSAADLTNLLAEAKLPSEKRTYKSQLSDRMVNHLENMEANRKRSIPRSIEDFQ